MKNDMEKIAEQMASQELTKHALTLLAGRIAYDAERDRARDAEEQKRWLEEGRQRQALIERLTESKHSAATCESLKEENAALKAADAERKQLVESMKDIQVTMLSLRLDSEAANKELRDEIEKLKTENTQLSEIKCDVKKLKSRMSAARDDFKSLSATVDGMEELYERVEELHDRVEELENATEEDHDGDDAEQLTAAVSEAQQRLDRFMSQ